MTTLLNKHLKYKNVFFIIKMFNTFQIIIRYQLIFRLIELHARSHQLFSGLKMSRFVLTISPFQKIKHN